LNEIRCDIEEFIRNIDRTCPDISRGPLSEEEETWCYGRLLALLEKGVIKPVSFDEE